MGGDTGLRSSAIMWIGPLLEKADKKKSTTEWLGHRAYDLLLSINQDWEFIDFRPRGTIGIVENDEQYEYMDKIFGSNGRMANSLTKIVTDKEEMKKIEPFLSSDIK